MPRPSRLAVTALGLAFLAPGCARDTRDYPSLAPRAVEKLGFAEPETKSVEVQPDPALDATIAAKRQDVARIATGFARAAGSAETAARAAKGKPVGSDAWLEAQSQLAGLDDWRAQASAVVTDVDALITGRAAALAPVYLPLATLHDEAAAEAAKESATIDRVSAMLPAA